MYISPISLNTKPARNFSSHIKNLKHKNCATKKETTIIPPNTLKAYYIKDTNQAQEKFETITKEILDKLTDSSSEEINTDEMIELLTMQDKNGNTPLHYAFLDKTRNYTRKLPYANFNSEQLTALLSVQNKNGNTPLHFIISNYQWNDADVLLSLDLDDEGWNKLLKTKNNFNMTPLTYIGRYRPEELYEIFPKLNLKGETLMDILSASAGDKTQLTHLCEICPTCASSMVLKLGLSKQELFGLLCKKDNQGNTIIHKLMTMPRNLMIIDIFFQRLAGFGFEKEDIFDLLSIQNSTGTTPMDMFIRNYQREPEVLIQNN